ncbi:GNAT family N-acetyltransferase [Vibrio cholerae]|nr:GNAT family N-acetyltransferase [Vibrio cholerae]TYA69483.1 GNAT family N-acetyltransferase [Vibrio cholerae]
MFLVELMPSANHTLIYELLTKVDADFDPPLSLNLDLVEYSKKIASKAILFTRFDDNTLIALCAIYATDKEHLQAYLTLLAVVPEFRGIGLAKDMITEMEVYVLKNGYKSIRLEVYKTNFRALSMYKGLGYEIVEQTDHSYFLHKIINDCSLILK